MDSEEWFILALLYEGHFTFTPLHRHTWQEEVKWVYQEQNLYLLLTQPQACRKKTWKKSVFHLSPYILNPVTHSSLEGREYVIGSISISSRWFYFGEFLVKVKVTPNVKSSKSFILPMEILGILSICNILFCALLFKCSCYVNAVCCTKHRGGTYLRINNSLFCQESTWLNFLVALRWS